MSTDQPVNLSTISGAKISLQVYILMNYVNMTTQHHYMNTRIILLCLSTAAASCTVGKNTLRIKTNPSNAEVYINGKLIGNSPLKMSFPKDTGYTIIVKKDGYREETRMVKPRSAGNKAGRTGVDILSGVSGKFIRFEHPTVKIELKKI